MKTKAKKESHGVEHVTKGSVFEDIGFSAEEARLLEAKSLIWSALDHFIKKHKIRSRKLETILDISQPMVSDLTTGKIDKMTLDKLIRYSERLGIRIAFKINEPSKLPSALAA